METLRRRDIKAGVRVWSLADVVERPAEILQTISDALSRSDTNNKVTNLPDFQSMDGLLGLLQSLKNDGMNPYLAGDFTGVTIPQSPPQGTNVVRLR